MSSLAINDSKIDMVDIGQVFAIDLRRRLKPTKFLLGNWSLTFSFDGSDYFAEWPKDGQIDIYEIKEGKSIREAVRSKKLTLTGYRADMVMIVEDWVRRGVGAE